MLTDQKKAYGFAVGSVLLWSTVATAFKITLRHLDFIELLLYSSAASALSLLAILAAGGKLGLLRTFSGKQVLGSALLGFLNPFLYYMVLFKAYSLLPAQLAQPLNYTWPVVLVLLSIPLLGQAVGLRSILAVLVSFLGVLIISTEGNIARLKVSSPAGVALAVGSSVIWALYWIFNLRDKRDEVAKLFLGFCFGFLYALAAWLLSSRLRLPPAAGLAGAAYVGLFEMGITFVLWLGALRLSRTTAQVGILVYFSPFLSLVFIHFILGEKILLSTVVGLVFIVAGVVVQKGRLPIKDRRYNA